MHGYIIKIGCILFGLLLLKRSYNMFKDKRIYLGDIIWEGKKAKAFTLMVLISGISLILFPILDMISKN